MCNNIAFRLFFAILIIFSTARAADNDLDFDTLSNPSNKMSALRRAEALFDLSQKNTEIAEQCLDEIMEIAKGKYGLAKKRSASTEERTVVGKAIAALKRLCPAKPNPFERQEDTGVVEALRIRHLAVLKDGFNHIAGLMSMEETTQVDIFRVTFSVTKPTIIVTEAFNSHEVERDVDDEGGIIMDETLESSTAAQQPVRKLSNAATDGEEEDGDLGVFEAGALSIADLHQKKGSSNSTPSGTPKPSKAKQGKATGKHKPTGEGAEEVEHGQSRGSHRIAGDSSNSEGTDLEASVVVVQVDDAVEQEQKERGKKKAAELFSKQGRSKDDSSAASSSALPKQSQVIGGGGEKDAVAVTDSHDDGVVNNAGCCGGRRWRLFGRR